MDKTLTLIIQIFVWIALIIAVKNSGYQEPVHYIGAIVAYYGFFITITTIHNMAKQTQFYQKYKNFMFFTNSLSIILCYFATLIFFFPYKEQANINIEPDTKIIENKSSESLKNKDYVDVNRSFLTKNRRISYS